MQYKQIQVERISRLILQKNTPFTYDIYINEKENIYTKLIENEQCCDSMIEKKIKEDLIHKFFIKKVDLPKYKQDIQDYISNIIKDDNVDTYKKAEIIQDLAYESLVDLFENEISELRVEKISSNIDNTIYLLQNDANALKALLDVNNYDFYTYCHCIEVATYSIAFGIYLDLPKEELAVLGKAAIFHDLGKKHIDINILNKDTKLTQLEFELMKEHPKHSVEILRNMQTIEDDLLVVIYQHHEKLDGSGYPLGLKNDQIHYLAKILSVVDIFHALTSVRSYKDRLTSMEAFELILKEMKDEVCMNLLEDFIKFMGIHKK